MTTPNFIDRIKDFSIPTPGWINRNIGEPLTRNIGNFIERTSNGAITFDNIPVNSISKQLTGYNLNELDNLNEDIEINSKAQDDLMKSYARQGLPSVIAQYDIQIGDEQLLTVDPNNLGDINNQRAKLANQGYVFVNSRKQQTLRENLPDWEENNKYDPHEKVYTGLEEEKWIKPKEITRPEKVFVNSRVLAEEIRKAEEAEPQTGLTGAAVQIAGDIGALVVGTALTKGRSTPVQLAGLSSSIAYMSEIYDRYDVAESIVNPENTFEEAANAIEFGLAPVSAHIFPVGAPYMMTAKGALKSLGKSFSNGAASNVVYKDMVKNGLNIVESNPTIEKALITEEALNIRSKAVENFGMSDLEVDTMMKIIANKSLADNGDANVLFKVLDIDGINQKEADFLLASAFKPQILFQEDPVVKNVDDFSLEFNFTEMLNTTNNPALIKGGRLTQVGYNTKSDSFKIGQVFEENSLLNFLEKPKDRKFNRTIKLANNVNLKLEDEEIAHLDIVNFLKNYKYENNTNVISKNDLLDHIKLVSGTRKITTGFDQYTQFHEDYGFVGDVLERPEVSMLHLDYKGLSDDNVVKKVFQNNTEWQDLFPVQAEHYANLPTDDILEFTQTSITKNVTPEQTKQNLNVDLNNIIVHVRTNVRETLDKDTGKTIKMFFLDELQRAVTPEGKDITGEQFKKIFNSPGLENATYPGTYIENSLGEGFSVSVIQRDAHTTSGKIRNIGAKDHRVNYGYDTGNGLAIYPVNNRALQNVNSENINTAVDPVNKLFNKLIKNFVGGMALPSYYTHTFKNVDDEVFGFRKFGNASGTLGNPARGNPAVNEQLTKVDILQNIKKQAVITNNNNDNVVVQIVEDANNIPFIEVRYNRGGFSGRRLGYDERGFPKSKINTIAVDTIAEDVVRKRSPEIFGYSLEDIMNGKTGHRIVQSKITKEWHILGVKGGELAQGLTDKRWGYPTKKEAAQAVKDYYREWAIKSNHFLLPPNFLFNESVRKPALRMALNQAASKGNIGVFSFNNASNIAERTKTTTFRKLYDNDIKKDLIEIVHEGFKAHYNPAVTRKEIESLLTTNDLRLNTSTPNDTGINNIRKVFEKGIFNKQDLNKAKNHPDGQYFLNDIKYPSGYEEGIKNALDASTAKELEQLARRQHTQLMKSKASVREKTLMNDVINILEEYKRKSNLIGDFKHDLEESMEENVSGAFVMGEFSFTNQDLPPILRDIKLITNILEDRDGFPFEKNDISVLGLIKLLGVSKFNVKSKRNDIVNTIADLALSNAQNKRVLDRQIIDNSIGTGDLVNLTHPEKSYENIVNGIRFAGYELHNGDQLTDMAKKLGWTTPPISKGSVRNIEELFLHGQHVMFQTTGKTPQGGKVRGFTDFSNDGRYIIRATQAANFNTFAHELGHVFRRTLTKDQLKVAGEFAHGKDVFNTLPNDMMWTREAEETFANAFETYITTGFAKNTEIKGIFETLKQWMINIYRAIKGTNLEESLDPSIKELFDDLIRPVTPSKDKINNNLPTHLQGKARAFYGINEPNIRVFDSGNGKNINRVFQTVEEDEVIQPPMQQLSSLKTMEETINVNLQDPSKIVLLPGLKQLIGTFNPAAIANDPLKKSLIALRMLEEEGKQLAEIAFSRLGSIGSQARVFGSLDDAGRLQGDLKGFNVNDIRANPEDARWATLLSDSQKEWIRTANELEEAKLAMFKSEGIDINELDVEEGGFYAGRRVLGKMLPGGEIVDVAVVGGPSRPGMKTAQEKKRIFETAEEAIEAGYRYLDDDETLLLNLNGAYRRSAQKRFVDYLTTNVVYTRGSEAPDAIVAQRGLATRRYEAVKTLIDELQRAKRGGSMSAATKTMLETWLPEMEGMLDNVSKISLEQLIKAGKVAADQPVKFVPRKGVIKALFTKVKQLETEIEILKENGQEVPVAITNELNVMKSKLGFQKFAVGQAYKNFNETGKFEYTFEKSATSIFMADKVGAIDELLEVARGKAYTTTVNGKEVTRYKNGFIDTLKNEKYEADQAYTKSKELLQTAKLQEGTLAGSIPALNGKFFTANQPTNLGTVPDGRGGRRPINGQDVANIIGDDLIKNQEVFDLLTLPNTINAASRFFMLAGDASLFAIQLLFLSGQAIRRPQGTLNVVKGFINGFISPEAHAKMIDNNKELLERNRGVLLSIQGTEFTDFARQMTRAGFVRSKPVRLARDVASVIPGAPQAGRAYLGFFRGSQRAFELAMDTAGVEMLKAFDHAGTNRYDDPVARQQLADFINEFRGLANPARLGVSTKQRQLETLAMLAPRYNRAIAAMITDIGRLNLRGQLARQTLASGIAAISAMGVAISIALGEDVDEIAEHYDPRSSKFMTWNVGGQQIGFGTKVRSLIKLGASIYVTAQGDEPVDLFTLSMDNPIVRFARGNASPVIGDTISILNGRSYLGDPVFGDSPFDLSTHIKNFSSEILLPKMMPIWAQSVVLEGGNPGQRATRGLVEFFGGRAYPEGSWQIMNNFANDQVGIPYDELEPYERKLLRELNEDELLPLMEERVYRGDTDAIYWQQLDQLDKDRYDNEMKLLAGFANSPEFRENGRWKLYQEFQKIQSIYSINREALNKQFGKYQDDTQYDPDDPAKFVLSKWYELYDLARDPISNVFSADRLQIMQANFWNRQTEDGIKFSDFRDYITRNTSNTKHPEPYLDLLPKSTTSRWIISEQARKEHLNNRGYWSYLLDNR